MQKELFTEPHKLESKVEDDGRISENTSSPFERIRVVLSLEKVIFLVLANLVGFVLAYSLGFQNGRISGPASEPHIGIKSAVLAMWNSIACSSKSGAVPKGTEAEKKLEVVAQVVPDHAPECQSADEKNVIEVAEALYTIQLITYQNRSRADREIKTLNDLGYESFLIPSGKYYQVCVDRFQAKSDASKRLFELKSGAYGQIYRGAYIRPVKR